MKGLWAVLTIISFSLSSCAWGGKPSHVKEAEASLKGGPGTEIVGRVTFKEVEGGVEIAAEIKGLTQGLHGFHIHEKGDCSAPDFSSAGGHFNPTHESHGGPDDSERHAGDLGNIVADENGVATYHRIDKRLKLNGSESIIGKGVIVHAKKDDLVTQPTGDAGGRVACGVIIVSPVCSLSPRA